MGLFSRQLQKVIHWSDTNHDIIVYKFPMDDRAEIMTGSSLTVREGQTAIFTKDGKIADVFAPGKYKLSTKNLPFLTSLGAFAKGFNSPFKCDVYFVKTTQFANQKWGTANPFTMRDKDFGMIRVRGFGSYSFRINDPKLFMLELFGSKHQFNASDINDYLRSIILNNISDVVATSKISAIDLAGNLTQFNEIAKTSLQKDFNELGFELVDIFVENLSFPPEVEKAIDQRTSVGIMADQMDNYVAMERAKAMRDAANNTGSVGTMFGMGVAGGLAGGVVGGAAAGAGASAGKGKFCHNCGSKLGTKAKFCTECGTKQ